MKIFQIKIASPPKKKKKTVFVSIDTTLGQSDIKRKWNETKFNCYFCSFPPGFLGWDLGISFDMIHFLFSANYIKYEFRFY